MAGKIKDECEAELAVAMPILNDALAALDTIKEADIAYIRKLGNPPGAIKLVMEVSTSTAESSTGCAWVSAIQLVMHSSTTWHPAAGLEELH